MADLGWLGILEVIGALALFIYGMKVMSEGVQRLASLQLRDALQRVTQNKVSSFLTGFLQPPHFNPVQRPLSSPSALSMLELFP